MFELYGYSGYDDPHCVPAGKRTCEIDHLISRELGGADVMENLWPQAYVTSPWKAVLKDKLENQLHKEMCAGVCKVEFRHAILFVLCSFAVDESEITFPDNCHSFFSTFNWKLTLKNAYEGCFMAAHSLYTYLSSIL